MCLLKLCVFSTVHVNHQSVRRLKTGSLKNHSAEKGNRRRGHGEKGRGGENRSIASSCILQGKHRLKAAKTSSSFTRFHEQAQLSGANVNRRFKQELVTTKPLSWCDHSDIWNCDFSYGVWGKLDQWAEKKLLLCSGFLLVFMRLHCKTENLSSLGINLTKH